jgi:hypothetical protein
MKRPGNHQHHDQGQGPTRKPIFAWNSPERIRVNDFPPGGRKLQGGRAEETRKERPMAAQAMNHALDIRLPKKRFTANPMAGNNGIKPT